MKLHFYKIKIETKYLYRLLNNITKSTIKNIRIDDNVTQFIVEASDKNKLQSVLDKTQIIPIEIVEGGIVKRIKSNRILAFVCCMTVFFTILLVIMSRFVWNIDIDGNYTYTDEQIKQYIYFNKIKEGKLKNKIDIDDLENKIRNHFDKISWISVEIKGTNLKVHTKENYISEIFEKEDKPYDIVSNYEGIINSILVRSGESRINVGDKVKEGDVLISGAIDVVDESEQKLFKKFYKSDGDIRAIVIHKYEDRLKEKYYRKDIEKVSNLILPTLFNYRWIGNKDSVDRDLIYSEKQIKLLGNFYLPVSIQKYKIVKYKKTNNLYTKEEAEDILNNNLLYKLAIMEQKGYKILKKDVKIERIMDYYILKGDITCNQPIGIVSYIDISQYKETEGTTEFNECN